MEPDTYTIIPDSFLDLDLTLTETVILSVIHGFCQDGESDFHGSYAYLARKAKIQRRQTIYLVGNLIRKGFVTKEVREVNGVKFCSMRTTLKGSAKNALPVQNSHLGSANNALGGSVNNAPNNIEIENKEKEGETRVRTRFTPPTMTDVIEYFRANRFQSSAGAFHDHFTQNGWRSSGGRGPVIKDWKAAARNWERRMRSGEFKQ